MSFDLRTEHWLPFRRFSGRVEWGSAELLTDAIETDPVVALACPRPDFDGAVTEFLIGLLTASYRPRDEDDWWERWKSPPSIGDLRSALLALPPAFDLDGEDARFFQDYSLADLAEVEISPIQEILVEGKNDPLYMKPGTLRQIGRPAAAMALITIQSYSPAGGRGYRTSLRGGGPLTTLVDPRPSGEAMLLEQSLWRQLWANVLVTSELPKGAMGHRSPAATFPWLAPTRTSERDRATTIADVDPLQCFFGMPRRIRLEFGTAGRCDLTGREDERLVTGFRVKGYGVQYKGWKHPFTPYYAGKADNEWLPLHGQPGGIGWRDWYPLIHMTAANKKMPAQVVTTFNERRAERVGCERYSLHVFGFDVTNAKVRSWIDARLPGFAEPDPVRLQAVSALVASLTEATELVAFTLQRLVVAVLYGGSEAPPGDLSFIKSSLWQSTERAFYDAVFQILIRGDDDAGVSDVRRHFRQILGACAAEVFDAHVAGDPSQPEQLRRSVVGRYDLMMMLEGRGKAGEKCFNALGLTTPKARRTRAAARAAAEVEA